MKLSQNIQILLVVGVFGLVAGGTYYYENFVKKKTNETIQPKQFVLFGDLMFNQKDDESRKSAYLYKEYFFQGDTFKLNFTPTYNNGYLKSLFCITIFNPINYSSFSNFLSLNYVPCQTGYPYGNYPLTTQQKIKEIINLNVQLIDIEKQIHEFKKHTQPNYVGSEEYKSNQIRIASICLQSVFIHFDGKSVIELNVPFHSYDTPESLNVSSILCHSYEDWIEYRKNEITASSTIYNFLRTQYGF